MIKTLTVTNVMGASKVLPLFDFMSSGFLIKEITGIGSDAVDIYTTELASADGSIYNSSHMPERDIDIQLMPVLTTDGTTIEERRLECYKYFPIKQKVTLLFETDTRIAQISGYVKKNEPEIFSEQETFSITVVCPDPYFYDVRFFNGISSTIFTGVERMFEFPFENDISDVHKVSGATYYAEWATIADDGLITTSLTGLTFEKDQTILIEFSNSIQITDNNKGTIIKLKVNDNTYDCYTQEGKDLTFGNLITIDDHGMLELKFEDDRFYYSQEFDVSNSNIWRRIIFSERRANLEQVVVYEGDIPYGVTCTVDILDAITDLKIYNIDTRDIITFYDDKIEAVTGAKLQAGDIIIMSTIVGDKYIHLLRGTKEYSLINCVSEEIDWFILNVGDNLFSYSCSDTDAVEFTMTHKTALVGI